MTKILLLDNYDSFTFNILHFVEEFEGTEVDVVRNNEVDLAEVEKYDGIILSPGPGLPSESAMLIPVIERYKNSKPIFGICLGMQAIGEVFGAKLTNLQTVYHGISTPIKIHSPSHYLFSGLPNTIEAGRYHSWVVSAENFPSCLQIDATDNEGKIMALSHKNLDICGVQFHPESILTPHGKQIIFSWLKEFQNR